MSTIQNLMKTHAQECRKASHVLRTLHAETRTLILHTIARELLNNTKKIIEANKKDVENAQREHLSDSLIQRLMCDEKKIQNICTMVNAVADMPDILYHNITHRILSEDLILYKRYVPLGVIVMIFESRPDALVQIMSLCIKSANGILLKGGSEAVNTNKILYDIIQHVIHPYTHTRVPLLTTREEALAVTQLTQDVDLIIPRGSASFVSQIMKTSAVPVLGHADGICHIYIHPDANITMARDIIYDAKLQYPAVCNAVECLIVHEDALIFLPTMLRPLAKKHVKIYADQPVSTILTSANIAHETAQQNNWSTEYLDASINIKTVSSLEDAIDHINTYGSGHTDCIITKNEHTAHTFQNCVDSSSVMWNCSTRFADGHRYGLGAEVGISTSRIHARGPVGIEGLLSTQWIVNGKGHIVSDFSNGEKTFIHKDITQ